MNISIIGGSGFIGTHLTNALKEQHTVSIIDPMPPKVNDVNYIKGDATDQTVLDKSLKNCEVVINLASIVGVEINESQPQKTLNANIIGTRNVLEACIKNDVKKILFSSSSEVYGEPIRVPINENDSPIPISTYGIAKLAAEEYIKAYNKAYGLKYTIGRFFSIYGPGQSKDFVIPKFICQALKNEKITIHGNGEQVRAFCHIDDLTKAIELSIKKGDNEVFNFGNDKEPISIKNLADKIVKITRSKSQIIMASFQESNRNRDKEIIHRIPNVEKAKRLLGFKAQISLDSGINSVINSIK